MCLCMCVGSGRVMHLVVENCWLCQVFGLCGAASALSFYSILFDFLCHYLLTPLTIDPNFRSPLTTWRESDNRIFTSVNYFNLYHTLYSYFLSFFWKPSIQPRPRQCPFPPSISS